MPDPNPAPSPSPASPAAWSAAWSATSPSSPGPARDLRAALRPSWPLVGADELREELLAAWDRSGYHDLRHLADVLARLEELAAAGVGFPQEEAFLAAWFHDAVYDGERDAEERSASWAERSLPAYVGEERAAEVARLVRMTETHDPSPDDPAGCALSDADLAILAAPAERYAGYVAAVRGEYSHLDDDTFDHGRAQVLSSLAAMPSLFRTGHARERWESPARANLASELEGLGTAAAG